MSHSTLENDVHNAEMNRVLRDSMPISRASQAMDAAGMVQDTIQEIEITEDRIKEAVPTEGRTASIGAVRFSAMSLLARREHSQLELTQKLSRRFQDLPLVKTVIQNLADEALQCDDRFAEAFVAMRKRRGQGPLRIGSELKLKGIDTTLIDLYVYQTPHEEWLEIARDLCQRKYGSQTSLSSQNDSDLVEEEDEDLANNIRSRGGREALVSVFEAQDGALAEEDSPDKCPKGYESVNQHSLNQDSLDHNDSGYELSDDDLARSRSASRESDAHQGYKLKIQQQKKRLQQKARLVRFLQYRGFGGDIIRQVTS